MLYGLCMVLPWRVAALCSNSEHSVPPYNLAGALPLASPLPVECLCMCETQGERWPDSRAGFSVCVRDSACVDVCDGETGEGLYMLTHYRRCAFIMA